MHFSTALTAAAFLVSGTSASPLTSLLNLQDLTDVDLNPSNHYGAPISPWDRGAYPGWYLGSDPDSYAELTNIVGATIAPSSSSSLTKRSQNSAPVSPVALYTQTFFNSTGATQASDYMTYGLVDSVASCQNMCNTIVGCSFVNSYYDHNQMSGKGNSNQLTCSLFSTCHTLLDATNMGSQPQAGGSVDYITNSDGYCKIIGRPT